MRSLVTLKQYFVHPFQSWMPKQGSMMQQIKEIQGFWRTEVTGNKSISIFFPLASHNLSLKMLQRRGPKHDIPSEVLAAFCAIWRTLAGEESPVRLSGGAMTGLMARAGEDRAISGGLVARRALGGGGEGETLLRGPGLYKKECLLILCSWCFQWLLRVITYLKIRSPQKSVYAVT